MRPSLNPTRPAAPDKYATMTLYDPAARAVVDAAGNAVTHPTAVTVEAALMEGRKLCPPAMFFCDVRMREARWPRLGTPERAAVFAGCAADDRVNPVERCHVCPWWAAHPTEHPL